MVLPISLISLTLECYTITMITIVAIASQMIGLGIFGDLKERDNHQSRLMNKYMDQVKKKKGIGEEIGMGIFTAVFQGSKQHILQDMLTCRIMLFEIAVNAKQYCYWATATKRELGHCYRDIFKCQHLTDLLINNPA